MSAGRVEFAVAVIIVLIVVEGIAQSIQARRRRLEPIETLPCHFCDLRRADERISFATRNREIRPGLVCCEHRRYCNDSPVCIEAAFAWVGELEHAER